MAKIIDVVKYEGDNSTFIWKHPAEDFNIFSQLIVHESQEAIFFKDGKALDAFGPGRYTLETMNIPLIKNLIGLATDGESPFHCEVYFINKTVQMGIKWGTDSKVRYIDPDSGLPLELGACGEMNLAVADSKKLLVNVVGTMKGISWSEQGAGFTKSLQNLFKPLISNAVKTNLTTSIKEKNINLLEVDEHLGELSEVLVSKINPGFEEYGLTIPQFYLTTVVLPEDDPNFKRVRELYTINLQKRMIAAEADIKAARAQAEAQAGIAQAQAEAEINAAKRQAELERQTTQTAVAQAEAERAVISAQAEGAKIRATGLAEADVMRAKGYSEKDVLEAEVQKAYAQGLGQMGANAGNGGGNTGGGIASDMVGMMAGMKMAGMMMGQMDSIMGGTTMSSAQPQSRTVEATPIQAASNITKKCERCGTELPEGAKFCFGCGEKIEIIPSGIIVCPGCGKTVMKGKFCLECGYKFVSICPGCGKELPDGARFCLECGAKIN